MEKLTPLFIFLTGAAVLLQAGVLVAMYLTMRKSGERMEAIATEVKTKVLPTVEQAQSMLTEIRPKLQVIAENLQESTTVLRSAVCAGSAVSTEGGAGCCGMSSKYFLILARASEDLKSPTSTRTALLGA